MSESSSVVRDERTVNIENASYRWSYMVVTFGLLVATAYRAFVRDDSAWDLLGLVIIGGFVAHGYQAAHRVLTRRWVILNIAAMVSAAVIAALIWVWRVRAH